ncbi:24170_t:CDS:1, partial [Cetraspora pellucida]
MSNEKNLPSICNNSFTELLIKNTINSDNDQVINISKRADLPLHNSQDLLNSVIKELCDLYNKEVVKGNPISSIIYSIDQHFANDRQKPEEIIKLCLNNQITPI